MGYTGFRNGFNIQTKSAVDRRMFLTKAEMLTAETTYALPDIYFCICPDDGKFYIYDKNNEVDSVLGKYRPVDDYITFDTEESKAQINQVIDESDTVQEMQTNITNLENKQIGDIPGTLDGGHVQ